MPLGFVGLSVAPISYITTVNKSAYTSDSVSASINPGTLGYDAKAVHTNPSVAAAFSVESLTDNEAQGIPTTLTSLDANLNVNALEELIGEANITPPSVTAAFTIDAVSLSIIAKANIDSAGVYAELFVSDLDFDAEANITTSSVVTPALAAELESVEGKANTELFSVQADFFTDIETPEAVTFPYELYKNDFDRTRTIYLVTYGGGLGSTVHVPKQNATVFINPQDRRKTVYIDK